MCHQKEICMRKKDKSLSSRDRALRRAFYAVILLIGIAYISFGLICPYFHKEISCEVQRALHLRSKDKKDFLKMKKPDLSSDLLLFSERLERKFFENKECLKN